MAQQPEFFVDTSLLQVVTANEDWYASIIRDFQDDFRVWPSKRTAMYVDNQQHIFIEAKFIEEARGRVSDEFAARHFRVRFDIVYHVRQIPNQASLRYKIF